MQASIHKRLIFVAFSLIFILFSHATYAINVMPFSGELDLTRQTNYKFKVSNRGNDEAAVKISVQKWSFDQYGEEIREPSNDLIIFPKRMLLAANGERSVRVSYRRGIPPQREFAYRIIVEEVPMVKRRHSMGPKGASINVLTRYVTAFYVKPTDATSRIDVIESNPTEYGFQLRVRNKGNAHTHFIQPSVSIRQSGKTFLITDLDMLKEFSNTNIFASSDRVFDWEIPEGLRESLDLSQTYKVSIKWNCENCSDETDSISFLIE